MSLLTTVGSWGTSRPPPCCPSVGAIEKDWPFNIGSEYDLVLEAFKQDRFTPSSFFSSYCVRDVPEDFCEKITYGRKIASRIIDEGQRGSLDADPFDWRWKGRFAEDQLHRQFACAKYCETCG
jgi:hypothetical protein